MARVSYTAEELRKRGISIVKPNNIKFPKEKVIAWAKKGLDKFSGDINRPLAIEEDILYKKGIDPYYGQKWVFDITPIPAPRMTQGQLKLLHIHDMALSRADLALKRKLIRYFGFKDAMRAQARKLGFSVPEQGFHIVFYLPHRLNKPDIEGTPHQQKPDTDNMLKAFKDALCSRDQMIWDYRVSKLWCLGKSGRIEVTLIQ